MPPKTNLTATDLIKNHMHEKLLGSRDIEVTCSIDLCEYFEQKYGDGLGRARLKSKFLKLEQDLRNAIAWNPPSPITNVVAPKSRRYY